MSRALFRVLPIALVVTFISCDIGSNRDEDKKELTIENEPYFKYAWHLDSKSIFAKKNFIDKDADINVKEAWSITKGEGVIVAVIDESFEKNHPDLKDNVIESYSLYNNSSDVSTKVEDKTYHGSTVAGFIASPINRKGLVGVAPDAKLILIQEPYGSDDKTIEAFEYAKKMGAKVINCSWGSNSVSEAVAATIEDIKNSGITVVFASGNQSLDLDSSEYNDESELDSVIGVSASNEYNTIATYSNYGEKIDILAPGGDFGIYFGVGMLGIDDIGESGSDIQQGLVNNNYAFTNGTSFSAPIVSGVVALMLSVNPFLTPDEIREIIVESADEIVGNKITKKINALQAVNLAKKY